MTETTQQKIYCDSNSILFTTTGGVFVAHTIRGMEGEMLLPLRHSLRLLYTLVLFHKNGVQCFSFHTALIVTRPMHAHTHSPKCNVFLSIFVVLPVMFMSLLENTLIRIYSLCAAISTCLSVCVTAFRPGWGRQCSY